MTKAEATNNVKELREQLHLTQVELANQSGLSPETVRKIENGRIANPSHHTILMLSKVLCPDNPSALGCEHDDYTNQHKLLNQYADCINPQSMVPFVRGLLDSNTKDAVSHCYTAMYGYLRDAHKYKNSRVLMDALAASLTTATLAYALEDVEGFTSALLAHTELLYENKEVPTDIAEQLMLNQKKLSDSRLSSDISNRLMAIRSIFYTMYDNWNKLQHLNTAYCIISDILLITHISDDYTMRKMTFRAMMNYFLS